MGKSLSPRMLTTTEFCDLVGLAPKRFEQRRKYVRDLAAATSQNRRTNPYSLPVGDIEPGKHARFNAVDAVRMRAVVELEEAGLSFEDACRFVTRGAVTGYLQHAGQDDYLVVRYFSDDGAMFKSGGSRELFRAVPVSPRLAIWLNVTAVAGFVENRAGVLFDGLTVRGEQFFEAISD